MNSKNKKYYIIISALRRHRWRITTQKIRMNSLTQREKMGNKGAKKRRVG